MATIETEGLTRRFVDVVPVEDLTMTVGSGEVFGVLGPSGAGKSTTINMLLGFLDPAEGEACVLGRDVTGHAREVRRRIGLLPEGFEAYRNLTGREHVQPAIDAKQCVRGPNTVSIPTGGPDIERTITEAYIIATRVTGGLSRSDGGSVDESRSTLADHVDAALDHASDETARFHLRHAKQLLLERGIGTESDGDQSDAGADD